VLVQHHFLSLDPYMRGRMSDGKSYAAPQPLGEVMIGGTVGEVIASRAAGFRSAIASSAWAAGRPTSSASRPAGCWRKVDTAHGAAVGTTSARSACPASRRGTGSSKIIAPKAGADRGGERGGGRGRQRRRPAREAARRRAVGIAGGPAKCAYVVDELGFDACVDYKAHQRRARAVGRAQGRLPEPASTAISRTSAA
jgi:NADPH-dependent curcumin reductase CurA